MCCLLRTRSGAEIAIFELCCIELHLYRISYCYRKYSQSNRNAGTYIRRHSTEASHRAPHWLCAVSTDDKRLVCIKDVISLLAFTAKLISMTRLEPGLSFAIIIFYCCAAQPQPPFNQMQKYIFERFFLAQGLHVYEHKRLTNVCLITV